LRIGITDSGVGGLSVCAEIESRLRDTPVQDDLELLYLNAAIEDDYSYNSMPDRQTKLRAFDCFLHNIYERYQPDLLFIACNTLSVLFRDPYFDGHRNHPIEGIVQAGADAMLNVFEQENNVTFIVFATPTTVEEAVYGKLLTQHGVPANRVIEQACPGLPDAISNDRSGQLAADMLDKFIPEALKQIDHEPETLAGFLGCTHYGYQASVFERALAPLAPRTRVLNPNYKAAESVLSRLDSGNGNGDLSVEFITRYAIPAVVTKSLSAYIGKKAPATFSALENFTLVPELCGDFRAITSP
jgi:glutamate racemase